MLEQLFPKAVREFENHLYCGKKLWYTISKTDFDKFHVREVSMTDERKDQLSAEADGMIEGRNAVIEALRTQTNIDKIYIQRGETDKTLGHIASKARAAGIVVVDDRH